MRVTKKIFLILLLVFTTPIAGFLKARCCPHQTVPGFFLRVAAACCYCMGVLAQTIHPDEPTVPAVSALCGTILVMGATATDKSVARIIGDVH